MKFIKQNSGKLFLLAFLVLIPILSFAQGNSPVPCDAPGSGKLCNPIGYNTINEFIKVLLEGALKIGIPIIALAIIYSGFLFVSAQGNTEKITKAKQALLYTVIGAAVLLGSWAIAQLVSETILGVTNTS